MEAQRPDKVGYRNMRAFVFASALLLALAYVPNAQADAGTGGPRQYPQFRTASGLPGGCFGVTREGRFDIGGALSFSTPIGFSLSRGQMIGLVSAMSYDTQFQFIDFNQSDELKGINGTLAGMAGFSGSWGSATVSIMALSRILDHVINLQYQLPIRNRRLGVSVGVQDLFSKGGSMGNTYADDGKCSRSVFSAATYELSPGTFVSLAYGNYRFDDITGNISFPLTHQLKGCIEYDGYGWNTLASYSPSKQIQVSLGYVNQDYAFWSVCYRF